MNFEPDPGVKFHWMEKYLIFYHTFQKHSIFNTKPFEYEINALNMLFTLLFTFKQKSLSQPQKAPQKSIIYPCTDKRLETKWKEMSQAYFTCHWYVYVLPDGYFTTEHRALLLSMALLKGPSKQPSK